MIPKKIHYCWFGHGEIPELAIKCINSWEKYLPGYELILWNEDNFDLNTNQYVKDAYNNKKYAFVTDYVRLYALYNYGGIYMDTDVEVIKPLDKFLEHRAFTGCESDKMCVTGIMGAEQKNKWIEKLLDDYEYKKFIMEDGKFNILTNTEAITKITKKSFNWIEKDEYQVLEDDIHIYSSDVFCAKNLRSGVIKVTDETHTIHHFSGSWLTEAQKKSNRRKLKIRGIIVKVIGEPGFEKLSKIRDFLFRK